MQIKPKKKLCKCGCGQIGYIWARGYLKGHEPKKPQPIAKFSAKKKESMKDDKQYYRWAIASNIAKNNGKCYCEECGVEIQEPIGMNVSHILSKGAWPEFYNHQLNHNILCLKHHHQWEFGDKKSMKIYKPNQLKIEQIKASK